jgi:gamma-glutamyltranspeptidase
MNPDMARVLRRSRALGPLEDSIMATLAGAIVDKIRKHGGVMTSEDLNNHGSFPQPDIALDRNVKLWQVPPNGQGIAALIALNGLQTLEDKGICPKMTPETVGQTARCLTRGDRNDAIRFCGCPQVRNVSRSDNFDRLVARSESNWLSS